MSITAVRKAELIKSYAQAEGAAKVAETTVTVKRVPELVPPEVARKAGYKLDQRAPVAEPLELGDYDGILFGTPTRFGNMASQMRNFLDQTGPLWAKNALLGKVGSVFTCTQSQHGGQETTITSFHSTLLHHGMMLVGIPFTERGLNQTRTGGTPYGATHVAGFASQPGVLSEDEIALAQAQGKRLAGIAATLAAGRAARR